MKSISPKKGLGEEAGLLFKLQSSMKFVVQPSVSKVIASNCNQCLFNREMSMETQDWYPNLLQFIGATLEGELMPTSV